MCYLFRLRGCDMLGITEGEREEIFSIVSVLVIVRRGASKVVPEEKGLSADSRPCSF